MESKPEYSLTDAELSRKRYLQANALMSLRVGGAQQQANYKKALEYLKEGADLGSEEAQMSIGQILVSDEAVYYGVKKDLKAALYYFQQAVYQNDCAPAIYTVCANNTISLPCFIKKVIYFP